MRRADGMMPPQQPSAATPPSDGDAINRLARRVEALAPAERLAVARRLPRHRDAAVGLLRRRPTTTGTDPSILHAIRIGTVGARVAAQQFRHVEWAGLALWDMIQPSFMFVVGTVGGVSLTRREHARGDSFWPHVRSRSLSGRSADPAGRVPAVAAGRVNLLDV